MGQKRSPRCGGLLSVVVEADFDTGAVAVTFAVPLGDLEDVAVIVAAQPVLPIVGGFPRFEHRPYALHAVDSDNVGASHHLGIGAGQASGVSRLLLFQFPRCNLHRLGAHATEALAVGDVAKAGEGVVESMAAGAGDSRGVHRPTMQHRHHAVKHSAYDYFLAPCNARSGGRSDQSVKATTKAIVKIFLLDVGVPRVRLSVARPLHIEIWLSNEL